MIQAMRGRAFAVAISIAGVATSCEQADSTVREDPVASQTGRAAEPQAPGSELSTWREERYAFRADFLAEVAAAPASRIHLQGELRIAVLPGTPLRRRFLLAGPTGSGTQGSEQTWTPERRELERAFYVEYDARGVATHLVLAPGSSVQVRRAFDTLATELQVATPAEHQTHWEVAETDNMGTYTAAYERTQPGRLSKQKTAYMTSGNKTAPTNAGLEVVRSAVDIELDADGGLLGLKANNVVSIRQLQVRSGVELELRDRSVNRPDSRETPPPPPADYVRYPIGKASEHSERERDQALTAGLSLEKIVGALQTNTGAPERADLRQRLAALLRLDGKLGPKLVDSVRRQPETAQELISALVLAGTTEAQQMLQSILEDASLDASIREHAAIFSAQIKAPTVALLSTLFDEFKTPESPVRQVAGYATGTVIAAMPNDPVAAQVVTELVERLEQSQDADERHLLLGMLGNAGDKSALPALLAAAKSTNDAERAQAVRCVRNIDTPETRALVRGALRDPRTAVRLSALESISKLGHAEFTPALIEATRRERDERVQLQLLSELAGRRSMPGVLSALDWVARNAASARARGLAQRIKSSSAARDAAPRSSVEIEKTSEPRGPQR